MKIIIKQIEMYVKTVTIIIEKKYYKNTFSKNDNIRKKLKIVKSVNNTDNNKKKTKVVDSVIN